MANDLNFTVSSIHSKCRSCNSTELDLIFTQSGLPMPEGHVKPGDSAYTHDIQIYQCDKCGLIQTLEDLDLDEYYSNYSYTTGSSAIVSAFMSDLASNISNAFHLPDNSLVVEIGSGDGEQLKAFKSIGCSVAGIEPSEFLSDIANENGIYTIKGLFDEISVDKILKESKHADLVLIQYTFDHLPNPAEFLRNCYNLLGPDGLLFIEVHDADKIVERREACLFTHEHSIYPSHYSINNMLSQHGFSIISDDLIPESRRRGNSLVVLATKSSSLKFMHIKPKAYTRNHVDEISNLQKLIDVSHKKLFDYVDQQCSTKKICGYGAAARGIDTCVIAGLKYPQLHAIYDKNASFHGLLMPVSDIPVKCPNSLFEDKPDELIVFSYGYISEVRDLYSEVDVKITSLIDLLA